MLIFVTLIAAEAMILGFQHYLVMLGTTVIIPTTLVPLMGGGNVMTFREKNSKIRCIISYYSFKFTNHVDDNR